MVLFSVVYIDQYSHVSPTLLTPSVPSGLYLYLVNHYNWYDPISAYVYTFWIPKPSPSKKNWQLLLLFYFLCRAQRGSDLNVFEIRGGLQGDKWVISRHGGDKACTDSTYVHQLWRDQLFMWRSRYTKIFIGTYIPIYKGFSLRKSVHKHRCYFGFPFEVRFCHVISCICIAISESENANSQFGKPKALVLCFSQLINVSLGGFDVNCTANISTLQY